MPPVVRTVTWFTIGGIDFEAGTLLDGLAVMMLFTVCVISLLVHIYSTDYLHGDVRFTHYFAFLSLFTASMLFYVLSVEHAADAHRAGSSSASARSPSSGTGGRRRRTATPPSRRSSPTASATSGLIIGVIITFFAAGAASFNVLHINEYALSR